MWRGKLSMILRGDAPVSLLDSYHIERSVAADENIRASTRATDFIAPHSPQERRMRKMILQLAKETEFAKRMVNGGRLSIPSIYDTPLSTPDIDAWAGGPCPGAQMIDAPLTDAGRRTGLSDRRQESFRRICVAAIAERVRRRDNGVSVHPDRRSGAVARCIGSFREAL